MKDMRDFIAKCEERGSCTGLKRRLIGIWNYHISQNSMRKKVVLRSFSRM